MSSSREACVDKVKGKSKTKRPSRKSVIDEISQMNNREEQDMANAIALSRSQSQGGRGYGGGETYDGGGNAPGDYYEQSIPTSVNLDDDEEEEEEEGDHEEEEDEQQQEMPRRRHHHQGVIVVVVVVVEDNLLNPLEGL